MREWITDTIAFAMFFGAVVGVLPVFDAVVMGAP